MISKSKNYANRTLFKRLPVLCLILVISVSAKAQRQEFGFGLGALNYKGELAPNFSYKNFKPGVQLFYRHNFTPALALRANLLAGTIGASSETSQNSVFQKITPTSFSSPIVEFAGIGEYNFLDYRKTVRPDLISPYLFGGIGLFYFKPTSEGKNKAFGFQPAVPFGVGAKFAFGRNWNLNLEAGARKLFTKLLDGRNDQLPNGTYQTPGGSTVNYPSPQRGYQNSYDWYGFIGFNLSYTIFVIPCPDGQKNGWQPNPGEQQ